MPINNKEENIVFEILKSTTSQRQVLVEHNQARYYVRQMKKLLNLPNNDQTRVLWIGYGQSYIDLLIRHIDKENNVAYPYANKVLHIQVIEKHF